MIVRSEYIQFVIRAMAWLCLAAIALATVGPIGTRPITGLSPSIERFFAFAIVGALFSIAYPRYVLFAAAIVLGAAALLEMLQMLTPSRHGRAFDAAVKIVGGAAGLCAGRVVARRRRQAIDPRAP